MFISHLKTLHSPNRKNLAQVERDIVECEAGAVDDKPCGSPRFFSGSSQKGLSWKSAAVFTHAIALRNDESA